MFCKLAVKNVSRSLRDYSVYFITLAFGVCIFYVFNSMDAQYIMDALRSAQSNIVEVLVSLIDILSAFVSVVLGFLILYANDFMIRRRKRELGTYLLLGMEGRKVSGLLILETFFIGLLSLGAGLALGVVLSQFISQLTAGVFRISMPQARFVFSPRAVGKTAAYFGLVFLVVMAFHSFSMSRKKLIDLLQAHRENQDLKLKSVKASLVMFLVGAVLLGTAYAMLLIRGILRVDALFFVMLGLGTAGTLLFFRSLSGFLLKICQSAKGLYYRGLNMFILRQFNARINTTYLSMTVICLMLLLAIGITACSVGLNGTISALTDGTAPYDVTVLFWPNGGKGEPPLEEWLAAGGFDAETELSERLCFASGWGEFQTLSGSGETAVMSVLPQSACQRLLAMQGREPLALESGQYGFLLGPQAELPPEARETALEVDGRALLPGPAVRAAVYTGANPKEWYAVLPDAAMESVHINEWSLVGNYAPGTDQEKAGRRLEEAMRGLVPQEYGLEGDGYGSYWSTKLEMYAQTMGSKIIVLFLGIYLGIVFLLCSAAVLALQQLSQAADHQERYRVLSRLGVEEKMRDRSIYVQVLLAFLLPLGLAVVHAAVGMTAANAAIAEVGRVDSAASSAVTAAFILAVYGAYLLATCWGSRRIVRSADRHG